MDAVVLRALAEPNRLRIVEVLRERPHAVHEIVDLLQMAQPQVSKHLRTLVSAGLVTTYPVAQQRYYGLRGDRLRELHDWAAGFTPLWDTRSSIRRMYERALEARRPIPAPGHAFRVEHVAPAPPAAVWRAWTEPQLLAAWFAPDYFTVPTCELDPRPGGELRLTMQAPDGTTYPMEGEFDTVDEPHRLAYLARPLDQDGAPLFELMLTLTIEPLGSDKAALTVDAAVLHAGRDAAAHLAGLESGWRQNLAKLDLLLVDPSLTGKERP